MEDNEFRSTVIRIFAGVQQADARISETDRRLVETDRKTDDAVRRIAVLEASTFRMSEALGQIQALLQQMRWMGLGALFAVIASQSGLLAAIKQLL